jgi:hypothetical protein
MEKPLMSKRLQCQPGTSVLRVFIGAGRFVCQAKPANR